MVKACFYIDKKFINFLIAEEKKERENIFSDRSDQIKKILRFLIRYENIILFFKENKISEAAQGFMDDLYRVSDPSNKSVDKKLYSLNETKFNNRMKQIGELSPVSVCFVYESDDEQVNYIEKKGFHCITKKAFNDFINMQIIKQSLYSVNKKGDIKNWKDMNKLSHNFNTLVILDRYLFVEKNNYPKYYERLSELVSNLLINNKSEEIEILLISVKQDQHREDSLKDIEDKIQNELQKKVKHKNFKLGIIKCKFNTDYNHPRLIFTNICAFKSENSFNYFKIDSKESTINTTIDAYSLFNYSDWEKTIGMLRDRKDELPTKADEQIEQTKRIIGTCDIELLRML